jgi:acyl carrier protein
LTLKSDWKTTPAAAAAGVPAAAGCDGVAEMSSLEELQDLIHRKYGIDPAALDPHASMRAHGVDSLTLVEMLFSVEDHFGISVPEKYAGIDTLAELAKAVDELRAEQAASAPA